MAQKEDTGDLLNEFESELKKSGKMPSMKRFSAPSVPLPSFSNRDLKDPSIERRNSLAVEPEEPLKLELVMEESKEEVKDDEEERKKRLRETIIQRIRAILMSRRTNKAAELRRLLSIAGAEKDEKLNAIVRKYEAIVDSGNFEEPTTPKEGEKKEEPKKIFAYDEKEEKRSSIYSDEPGSDMRGGIYKIADKGPDHVAKEDPYRAKDTADVDAKEAVDSLSRTTYGEPPEKKKKTGDSPYLG